MILNSGYRLPHQRHESLFKIRIPQRIMVPGSGKDREPTDTKSFTSNPIAETKTSLICNRLADKSCHEIIAVLNERAKHYQVHLYGDENLV